MELDIESLRLTDEEMQAEVEEWVGSGVYPPTHAVRDAQLAKALWGILRWLYSSNADWNEPVGESVNALDAALAVAGIKESSTAEGSRQS